jgi:hypothetical protein
MMLDRFLRTVNDTVKRTVYAAGPRKAAENARRERDETARARPHRRA